MLFCLLLLLMSANIIANPEDCCPRSNNLNKAIVASNFIQVQKILKNGEALPLASQGAKQLATNMRAQRLERTKRRPNEVKATIGVVLIGMGLFNAFNLIPGMRDCKHTDAEWPIDVSTAYASLVAIYQGTKLTLDSFFKWTEHNDLSNAIAIEQVLKESEIS